MNLLLCERKKYAFMVLLKHSIITQNIDTLSLSVIHEISQLTLNM